MFQRRAHHAVTYGTVRTGELPSRTLPPVADRLRHVKAAIRAGVLTADEAQFMRDCINYGVDEYDIGASGTHPGEWEVWTHDGPKAVRWWQALYADACHRDRGNR